MALATTLSHIWLCGAAAAAAPPRNVLLLISDDLRAEIDVPGFGCTAAQCSTPNLRALATAPGSLTFTRAYVQQALCAPTRNSFMTGRRPDTTKAWNFIDHFRESGVGADWKTLPQVFKERGYTAVGTGKVFHKGLPPNWDLPYSWDERVANGSWAPWMYPSEPRCANGTVWCAVPPPTSVRDFDDTQITAVAVELLVNLTAPSPAPRAPWFLAVGWRKPHVQWRVPAATLASIPADSVTLPKHAFFPSGAPPIAYHRPENDFLEPFSDVVACGGAALMAPNATFPPQCVKAWRRAYHASVAFMDEQVGAVLGALDAAGEANNTLVVFFGDHGWQLGEWAEWEKFTNFELATRVPLIVRAPWLAAAAAAATAGGADAPAAGRVSSAIVELVDVMPTVIELALGDAAAIPRGCEGASLAPLFRGAAARGAASDARAAFSQFPRCCTSGEPLWKKNDCDDVARASFTHMGLSMRTDRWRLTRWMQWDGAALAPDWAAPDAGVELYDHLGDSGLSMDGAYEAVNVAAANAEVVEALSAQLAAAFGGPTAAAVPTLR
jgi:iduronate 2-sulfatase